MPMDYSRYPENWKQISLSIRERDGWKCKWCNAGESPPGARCNRGGGITIPGRLFLLWSNCNHRIGVLK